MQPFSLHRIAQADSVQIIPLFWAVHLAFPDPTTQSAYLAYNLKSYSADTSASRSGQQPVFTEEGRAPGTHHWKGTLVMYRRGLAVLIILVAVHTVAFAQDYQKVIEVVQRMEATSHGDDRQQEQARKNAAGQLRSEIAGGESLAGAAEPMSHEAAVPSKDPVARLQNRQSPFRRRQDRSEGLRA